MDLNRVRTFVAVVDNGGISQAARKLFRTPQAVSLQIRQLEEELKFNVLQHTGNKVVLTDAGQIFYQDVKPRLTEIQRSVENIRAGKEQDSGIIKVGIWLAQGVVYLPEIIESFCLQHGNVGFDIRIGDDDDQVGWLTDNNIDIAFVSKAPKDRFYTSRLVYAQPLIPVASRDFFRSRPRPENIRQTLSLPLIDFPSEFAAYPSWVRRNSRSMLAEARKKIPVVTAENSLVARELILRGIGFGFLHREVIETELAAGRLESIPVRGARANTVVKIKLLTKRKNSLGFVHREFVKAVVAARDRWVSDNH